MPEISDKTKFSQCVQLFKKICSLVLKTLANSPAVNFVVLTPDANTIKIYISGMQRLRLHPARFSKSNPPQKVPRTFASLFQFAE